MLVVLFASNHPSSEQQQQHPPHRRRQPKPRNLFSVCLSVLSSCSSSYGFAPVLLMRSAWLSQTLCCVVLCTCFWRHTLVNRMMPRDASVVSLGPVPCVRVFRICSRVGLSVFVCTIHTMTQSVNSPFAALHIPTHIASRKASILGWMGCEVKGVRYDEMDGKYLLPCAAVGAASTAAPAPATARPAEPQFCVFGAGFGIGLVLRVRDIVGIYNIYCIYRVGWMERIC